MCEIQAINVLASMREKELLNLFEKFVNGDNTVPMSVCQEIINHKNFDIIKTCYDKNLFMKFIQNISQMFNKKNTYLDLENPDHQYMYMLTIYGGYFMFMVLIVDINEKRNNYTQNIENVIECLNVSLSKLISIKCFVNFRNHAFFKVLIVLLHDYNIKNHEVICNLVHFSFSNKSMTHAEKVSWLYVLRKYIDKMPDKYEARFLTQKIAIVFRNLEQYIYGEILISGIKN